MRLSRSNQDALTHVRAATQRRGDQDVGRIARCLSKLDADVDAASLIRAVHHSASVTVNFHPDRLLDDGRTVALALRDEETYRSQFETSISNGGLTAFPGGARDLWEQRLFGGAYQHAGASDQERPKYGGLNVMTYVNGACPRFGSCHLRLTADSIDHSTFSYGDSAGDPEAVATIDAFEPVLALLEDVADSGMALGTTGTELRWFVERVLGAAPAGGLTRSIDHYIEAQIHTVLSLRNHVAAVVIDHSFDGTSAGDTLQEAATTHGFAVEWTPSLSLTADELPEDVPEPSTPPMHRWRAFCAGGRAANLARGGCTTFK